MGRTWHASPSTGISWQQADGVSALTHGLEMGMESESKFSLAHLTQLALAGLT